MTLVRALGAGRCLRRLRRRWRPGALVLLYHRISGPGTDPYGLGVSPSNFSAHLEVLRRRFQPVPLCRLVEGIRSGDVPARAVALTFDDGYADSLHAALPALASEGVPATFFLATGMLGRPGPWWDQLERSILGPSRPPRRLRLSIRGRSWEWDLGEHAGEGGGSVSWRLGDAPAPTPRHRLLATLYGLLRDLPDGERTGILEALRGWGGSGPDREERHRILTPAEVLRLARNELVEIGAHSITHPSLAALPVGEQMREVSGSRSALEGLLGRPVRLFAYPYGSRRDYSRATLRVVRESGLRGACVNEPGLVRRRSSPFEVPRLAVEDLDGERFAACLEEWLPP